MGTIRIILIAGAVAYLGLCASLFLMQRALTYFPAPASGDERTTFALPTKEAHVLVSTRPADGPRALLYFGGNAEDVSLSMPGLSAAFPNWAIYLLHYRGYGGSTGQPSEKALFEDALSLFDEVRAAHPKVAIIGRSLGSGVALYVASLRPVERLVLVTPFDSLAGVAAAHFPYVPVSWLLRDKFESWRYAAQVTAPTLIVAAEQDEIVPRASTDLLLSRFKIGLATLKVIPGAGHNSISNFPEYLPLLKGSP